MNRTSMRLWLFLMMIIIGGTKGKAQEKLDTKVSCDFVNQYIFRGQHCGDVSIQPTLGIIFKGLSLTAWGNVGLSNTNDTKEFDVTTAYSLNRFNIGIIDYWYDKGPDADSRYFRYNAHSTNHLFEANIGYHFNPISFQWYTNFAGNDGLKSNGKRAYSSYAELSCPFHLLQCDWTATAGFVPFQTTFYSKVNRFAVTNLSLQTVKVIKMTKDFSVPVFAGITVNPSNGKAYLIFGVTIHP